MRILFFLVVFLTPYCVVAADLPLRTSAIRAAVQHIVVSHGDVRQENCALRFALSESDSVWILYASNVLASLRGDTDPSVVVTELLQCKRIRIPSREVQHYSIVSLPVDRSGIPVSQNPVWNACVRGVGLSFDLIQSNIDRLEHRSGHLRITRPWTCRDYHRGPLNDWIYRDFGYDVHLYLSRTGSYMGLAAEPGYDIILYADEVQDRIAGTP